MFESIKRAYDRDAFTDEDPCPIDLKTTEMLFQILKPAYIVPLSFQKNSSTIGDTIRSILKLIDHWEKLSNTGLPLTAQRLCRLLIKCVKYKFKFEVNSSVHQVISLIYFIQY
jgi:hypothetical protein